MKRLFALVCVLVMAALTVAAPLRVHALSGADWQAGRIMDNSVFFNKDSMDASQIQAFLNAKVPVCDNWGTQPYAGTTRANYSQQHGEPLPLTCLKDYYENPQTHANNMYGAAIPPGALSAAQIIATVSQSFNINPQVLIVLLQKEQALVTDDWPWTYQYRSATGYGCPDSNVCNSQYYGFYNQVYNAARQFRIYADWPNSFNYIAGQNNNIKYSPGAGCGSTTVFIQNQATAGLYDYTPYTPNAAALANLNGSGDACSSYGNRNFWVYFNNWFGSTLGAPYQAMFIGQSNWPVVAQGDTAQAYLIYKNIGNNTWYDTTNVPGGDAPVTLGTNEPLNRASPFSASWASPNRPNVQFSAVYESDGFTLASNQHTVKPNQVAHFNFTFTVPETMEPGVYREAFLPLREGTPSWYMYGNAFMNVQVVRTYKAAFAGESAFPTVHAGETADAWFKFKNVGVRDWQDSDTLTTGQIDLATAQPLNRRSMFGWNGWGTDGNRPATHFTVFEADGTTLASDQNVVHPGQIAAYVITYTVTTSTPPGTYREKFEPIPEGKAAWYMEGDVYMDVTVQAPQYKAAFGGESNFPTISASGGTATSYIDFKNNGTTKWYDDTTALGGILPVHLATNEPLNRTSQFGATWGSGKNRPSLLFNKVFEADGVTLAANQHVVAPGQIGRFQFTFTVPGGTTPGTYREKFMPIIEGSSNGGVSCDGAYIDVTVQ